MLLLAEQKIEHAAPADVRTATVILDRGVGAGGVSQSIGEDGKAVELLCLVGGLRKLLDGESKSGTFGANSVERIAEYLT